MCVLPFTSLCVVWCYWWVKVQLSASVPQALGTQTHLRAVYMITSLHLPSLHRKCSLIRVSLNLISWSLSYYHHWCVLVKHRKAIIVALVHVYRSWPCVYSCAFEVTSLALLYKSWPCATAGHCCGVFAGEATSCGNENCNCYAIGKCKPCSIFDIVSYYK